MTDPDAPIQTTHVGSLVRPDELMRSCARRRRRRRTTRRPSTVPARSVGRRRPAAGRRRHRHRERRRVRQVGVELLHPRAARRLRGAPAARRATRTSPASNDEPDRLGAFPEFYAEYFAQRAGLREPGRRLGLRRPITYTGGDVDRARHRQPQGGDGRRRASPRASCRSSRRPRASRAASTSTTASEEAALRLADALQRGVPGDRRRRPVRCRSTTRTSRSCTTSSCRPATMDDYRAWAQLRIDALNHALEGIPQDQVRYHVCWGSWNGPHTNDVAAARHRRPHARRSTPAPTCSSTPTRATSTSGASGRTSSCPTARPSPRASSATRRTSSSTPSSSPSASSASRGSSARARHRQHRLRLRPGPVPPARAPDDPVGEARARSPRAPALASRALAAALAPGAPSSSAGARGVGPRPRPARAHGHAGRRRRPLAMARGGGRRRGRRRGCSSRSGRSAPPTRATRSATSAPTVGFLAALLVLADGCRREGLFDAMGGVDGRRGARGARGGCSRSCSPWRRRHRGAQPRRDGRAAHADRVRHRRAAAHQPAPARLRVLAPGQLGVAAAAGLQPDQPARLPRQRAVVHALRRAHGAARRPRVVAVEWLVLHALLRGRPRAPAARRAAGDERPPLPRFALAVLGLTLAGLRG